MHFRSEEDENGLYRDELEKEIIAELARKGA
jgi:hypothetical protein